MVIHAEDVGKKFGNTWVFRHLDLKAEPYDSLAITGRNGSGKSTLLQVLAGYLSPSQGTVHYEGTTQDQLRINFVAPYVELPEEFSLGEFLKFHSVFHQPLQPIEKIAAAAHLPLEKSIGEFSTGMKQRAKLSTSFYFQSDIICLDEPTSNLDQAGTNWFLEEITKISADRTILIASNQRNEIEWCTKELTL